MKMRSAFLRRLLCVAVPVALAAAVLGAVSNAAGQRVEVNAANFPDENFRSIVSTHFDTDNDGFLSSAELASVTALGAYCDEDYNSLQIADFTGIEYFGELTSLYGAYPCLKSLDVSQNTRLETLILSDTTEAGSWGSSLTSLDVTHNPNLKTLLCVGSGLVEYRDDEYFTGGNALTSLDLSQNSKLEVLACSGNQLASLDISQNAALYYLECYGNQLTSLDVSHNPALEQLNCEGNQLANLDVSGLPQLMYLYCGNNCLTKLDVSQNAELRYVSCYGNKIGALDLLGNTKLDRAGVDCDKGTSVTLPAGSAVDINYR